MSPSPFPKLLAGVRVLVVEDNPTVAMVIAEHLRLRGATVVGPAPSVPEALSLVDNAPFDAAILDIDLKGQHVTPVALRVRALGRPFAFLSGYGDADALPPELAHERCIAKPVQMDELASIIKAMAQRTGPAGP